MLMAMVARLPVALALLALAGCAHVPRTAPDQAAMLVYFGTYTGEHSQGIYVSRLDMTTGVLAPPELAAESTSPSFLALHPTGNFLYAVNEINDFEGQPVGSVSAFAIDRRSGRLTPINRQSSGGRGPAHLIVDAAGRNVLVANYGGGSAAVLPLDRTGALRPPSSVVEHTGSGVNPNRQQRPHAHAIQLDGENRFAYVPDLGIDKVMIYRFDGERGTLEPHDPPSVSVAAGAGPRHFAFHPQGRFAFVINELTCTITTFSLGPTPGALTAIHTVSTLPAGESVQKGYSTAEIRVHPSGRFVYGSNRGHDSIAVFALDQDSGRLTLVQHEPTQGSTPRNFGIDPSGRWLLAANQRSNSVVVFAIDERTGRLTPTGERIEVGAPVAVKVVNPES
jgi:6-phosphogluconolactonase